MDKQQDFLNWELDETLDINGWDLSKALQHFYKFNAILFEWSNSPVVYRTTKEWEQIRKETEFCFSCKVALNRSFREIIGIEKESVYKK